MKNTKNKPGRRSLYDMTVMSTLEAMDKKGNEISPLKICIIGSNGSQADVTAKHLFHYYAYTSRPFLYETEGQYLPNKENNYDDEE